jgi:hypothetical protein
MRSGCGSGSSACLGYIAVNGGSSLAERMFGLRYADPRETIRKTVEWARAEGYIR